MKIYSISRSFVASVAAMFFVFASNNVIAQSNVQHTYFTDKTNTAIKGYDVVAYFTDGKPLAGNPEFTHEWKGAKWQFVSAEHRDAFKAAPEKYAPEYGGYCAWGMTKGYKASTEPSAWKIVNGKLYLNYNNDVQQAWAKDIPGMIRAADAEWQKKFAEKPAPKPDAAKSEADKKETR